MKSLIYITAFLILAGCGVTGTQIRGNGSIQTVHRDCAAAGTVAVTGSFHTEITQGPPGISITGDQNILPFIITENVDERLEVHVKYRTVLYNATNVVVRISLPDIADVSLVGSGIVNCVNLHSARLGMNLTGSGTMNVSARSSQIDATLDGSGRININGETDDLYVRVNKSGELNSLPLFCKNAEVAIMGSGKARVFVSRSLKADIAGSGTIYYTGGADNISKNIVHSGRVVKM